MTVQEYLGAVTSVLVMARMAWLVVRPDVRASRRVNIR